MSQTSMLAVLDHSTLVALSQCLLHNSFYPIECLETQNASKSKRGRGAVAQWVERPSKVSVCCNSTDCRGFKSQQTGIWWLDKL